MKAAIAIPAIAIIVFATAYVLFKGMYKPGAQERDRSGIGADEPGESSGNDGSGE